MKKRLFIIISVVLTILLLGLIFSGCAEKPKTKRHAFEPDRQKTILYLGDSIAEAVAGPSPLTERETYGYYGVLGRINGFNFYNRAISGDQTKDLLSFIEREDDGVNMVKSLVSTADIIHLSIGGNDLLGYNISQMVIEAGEGRYDTADSLLESAYTNLDKIITRLHELNPGAVIIMQTQYNPVGKDSPLVSSYAKMRLATMAYKENQYHDLASKVIGRLNQMYRRYLEENKDKFEYEPFYLAEVAELFESIYTASPTRWNRLFCPDGVHPANEGHALIAQVNQKLLEQLGIASENALDNYKTLRSEQLSRLYSNSVEVSAVKDVISKCADFGDVSLAYFNATDGRDANYRYANGTPVGTHFDTTKKFSITKLSVRGLDLTKVYEPHLDDYISVMSEQSSYILFREDGTFEMKYAITDGLIELLRLLSDYGLISLPIDLTEIIDMDINYLQSTYLQHMFPGFDYGDLGASLQLLSDAVGVTITGPDFSTQAVREMANELAETGDLILRSFDALGDSLGITWTGSYRLVEQESALTGEKYTAIYIGEEFYTGETYLRFTYTPEENGKDKLRLTVDVADVVIEGVKK